MSMRNKNSYVAIYAFDSEAIFGHFAQTRKKSCRATKCLSSNDVTFLFLRILSSVKIFVSSRMLMPYRFVSQSINDVINVY